MWMARGIVLTLRPGNRDSVSEPTAGQPAFVDDILKRSAARSRLRADRAAQGLGALPENERGQSMIAERC